MGQHKKSNRGSRQVRAPASIGRLRVQKEVHAISGRHVSRVDAQKGQCRQAGVEDEIPLPPTTVGILLTFQISNGGSVAHAVAFLSQKRPGRETDLSFIGAVRSLKAVERTDIPGPQCLVDAAHRGFEDLCGQARSIRGEGNARLLEGDNGQSRPARIQTARSTALRGHAAREPHQSPVDGRLRTGRNGKACHNEAEQELVHKTHETWPTVSHFLSSRSSTKAPVPNSHHSLFIVRF